MSDVRRQRIARDIRGPFEFGCIGVTRTDEARLEGFELLLRWNTKISIAPMVQGQCMYLVTCRPFWACSGVNNEVLKCDCGGKGGGEGSEVGSGRLADSAGALESELRSASTFGMLNSKLQ